MQRPTHSTTVMTTLAAIVSSTVTLPPESRRRVRPASGHGVFIVGDLVLVPGGAAMARRSSAGATPVRR